MVAALLAVQFLVSAFAKLDPFANLAGAPYYEERSYHTPSGAHLPFIVLGNLVYAPLANSSYHLAYTAPGPTFALESPCHGCPNSIIVQSINSTIYLTGFDLVSQKAQWNVSLGKSVALAAASKVTSADGSLIAVALYRVKMTPVISVRDGKTGAELSQFSVFSDCKYQVDQDHTCSVSLRGIMESKHVLTGISKWDKSEISDLMKVYDFHGKEVFGKGWDYNVVAEPYWLTIQNNGNFLYNVKTNVSKHMAGDGNWGVNLEPQFQADKGEIHWLVSQGQTHYAVQTFNIANNSWGTPNRIEPLVGKPFPRPNYVLNEPYLAYQPHQGERAVWNWKTNKTVELTVRETVAEVDIHGTQSSTADKIVILWLEHKQGADIFKLPAGF